MKIFIQISIIIFLVSCRTKTVTERSSNSQSSTEPILNNSSIIKKDSIEIIEVVNGINFFNYELRRWNRKTWNEYINTGHSDTVVALYVYKLLTSDEEPDFSDWASYTQFYEKTTFVKSIVQSNFTTENSIDLILAGIDQINAEFVEYAKTQVKGDMKKYGRSDGPYFDFVQQIEK